MSTEAIPEDIREAVRAYGDEKFGEVALYGWPRVMEKALLAERIRTIEASAKIAENIADEEYFDALSIADAIRAQLKVRL